MTTSVILHQGSRQLNNFYKRNPVGKRRKELPFSPQFWLVMTDINGVEERKPYHALVLDAGPIIRNTPPVSTLIKNAQRLVTLPSVISEVRDEATRSRLDVTLKPFLEVREPRPESVKFVVDFARKTGDLAVLNKTDLRVGALAYEIECERHGDWRLRRTPGQKGLNGKPPSSTTKRSGDRSNQLSDVVEVKDSVPDTDATTNVQHGFVQDDDRDLPESTLEGETVHESSSRPETKDVGESDQKELPSNQSSLAQEDSVQSLVEGLPRLALSDDIVPETNQAFVKHPTETTSGDESSSDSSGNDDWITPHNLDDRVAEEQSIAGSATTRTPQRQLQVAIVTTDNALQNVLLLINLNVLSSANLSRIQKLRTTVSRCHACFNIVKDTSKQFCPRCGKSSLTRVSASTSSDGKFNIHLKKNYQWNHRGDRYSIPRPVPGTASGKVKGGGQGGWGNDLILAEDQKEYIRALGNQSGRKKEKDLMDEDVLPAILSGERRNLEGRPKIGAGKNVNAKRRKKR